MTEIMMDGEPMEVGNGVYCLRYGVGTVLDINKGSYPIVVAFSVGRASYTKDFKICNTNLTRDLYWQKPEIIPPPKPPLPKPKKKVKVWDWVSYCPDGFPLLIHRAMTEQTVLDSGLNLKGIEGTEREIEV